MKVQELPVKDWLAHLRRNPIPEIMDDACLDALRSVEAQYGEEISHGAGLEVRLGNEARYVDYIMNIDTDTLPDTKSLWYEIDYEEFLRVAREGGAIEPCLFANSNEEKRTEEDYWDKLLPPFLGEARAARLRGAFNRVRAALPNGAFIKQIGTMTSRGEIDVMRLVIMFPAWEAVVPGLAAVGWPGDREAFRRAMEPWKEAEDIAVNLDLGEQGVLPKIGVEVFSRWRHPLLVDRFIARLEEAELCLPSKAEALRRWIRIFPDGDPFIQTLISYFKLVYRDDGRIAEAKAYLEQSPYIHHHYFDAYRQPLRIDMELTDAEGKTMRVRDAFARLRECMGSRAPETKKPGSGRFRCRENSVRKVRFIGGEGCGHLDRLLEECRGNGLRAEVVLTQKVGKKRLAGMIEAGADDFLVDVNAGDGAALQTLKTLCGMGVKNVRARWRFHAGNSDKLAQAVEFAEKAGAAEFIVTGMNPCMEEGMEIPGRDQIERAADFIRAYRGEPTEDDGKTEETENSRMKLTVESCFSQLAAVLGGEDPTKNPNRGLTRGCEAGRTFFAIRADGSFSPCLYLAKQEKADALQEYWESPSMQDFRKAAMQESCRNCSYRRRCRPCPAVTAECPLHAAAKLSH